MTNDEIREKIKKLLRLGRSSNPHESDQALRRALEMAQRFSMSIEELDLEKDLEAIAEKTLRVGLKWSLEHKLAAGIVINYFGCEVVLGRPNFYFVGTDGSVEIGEFVFVFLVRQARAGKRRFMKANPRMGRRGRSSYINGFFWGISSNLREGRQQCLESRPGFALVLEKQQRRFSDYCARKWSLGKVARQEFDRNHSALDQGWCDGKKVEIHKPLAGATAPVLLEGV